MLIAADDENLAIAAEYGCQTLDVPNMPLGHKCNLVLKQAAGQADHVVWVGSDNWIHPDVFEPLIKLSRAKGAAQRATVWAGSRLVLVNLQTGRLQSVTTPSKYGAIPWIIDSKLLRSRQVTPIRPSLNRGLDGALIRGLRPARIPFQVSFHDPHEFRCVDFKTRDNITPYASLAKHLGDAPEEADPWTALAHRYPADLVEAAQALSRVGA